MRVSDSSRLSRSVLGLAAAIVLPACASTSLASTPTPPTVTVTTTLPATTTTTVPETTTTTVPASTTTTTKVPVTTTTTTVPPIPVAEPQIVGVGTSDGEETRRAQERLLALGYWLQDANGDYGLTTQQAVMAFQKYHGLTTDGVLGDETAAVLSATTLRPVARADAGTMVEVDKGLQLLFFIIDGRVAWVLNTSTGTEIPYREPNKNKPGEFDEGDSVTRNGLHEVYRQREEGWWEGDLGEIYRPKYFTGGIAVHGSNHIPDYPASHGCVRVSVPAMDWVWETDLMPMNSPVWVHEGNPDTSA